MSWSGGKQSGKAESNGRKDEVERKKEENNEEITRNVRKIVTQTQVAIFQSLRIQGTSCPILSSFFYIYKRVLQ